MVTWATIIVLPEGEERNMENLFEALRKRDPTFTFKIRKDTAVVYSATKSQAHQRGKWLTGNVEPLKGQQFTVTLGSEQIRPKEVLGLREYRKRKKVWE